MKEVDDSVLEVDDSVLINEKARKTEIPEEQKPEEYRTRHQLMEDLASIEQDSVLDQEFNASLRELNETMHKLLIPTEKGWPVLDRKRRDDLLRQYAGVGEALERFLKKEKEEKTEQMPGKEADVADPEKERRRFAVETAKKLSGILAEDFRTLRTYDPDKRKSFLSVLEDGRAKEIRIDRSKAKTMGGAISERVPLQMERPDGSTVRGFFTAEDRYSAIDEMDHIGKEAAGLAKTRQGMLMLNSFYQDYLNFYSGYLKEGHQNAKNRNYNSAVEFLKNISEKEGTAYKVTIRAMIRELAFIHDMTEKDVRRLCGDKALTKFLAEGKKAMTVYGYMSGGGIVEGSRKDQRNAAMSTVADILGVSSLVCYAKPMRMVREDGSEIKGTFMAAAEGLDPSNPDPSFIQYILGGDFKQTLVGRNGTSLRKISDLQVLDYICGNMDRHAQNLFYQMDGDGNVTGIQGIDNDTSFGTIGKEARNKNVYKMIVPENMGVISKEMAEHILELKPEQLEFALRGQLKEEEIRGAVERLENMKDAIRVSRKNLSGDGKTIRAPYLREVAVNEWKQPWLFDGLQNMKHENMFKRIWKDFPTIPERYYRGRYEAPVRAEAESPNRAEYAGITGEVRAAKQFEKELANAVGKPKYATADYRAFQAAVEEYRRKTEAIRQRIRNCTERVRKQRDYSPESVTGRYVSHSDLTTLTNAARKMKEAAEQYYNHATDEVMRNGGKPADIRRTKQMKRVVKAVHKHVKELIILSESEKKQLQQNQRRQTDDMMRVITRENSISREKQPAGIIAATGKNEAAGGKKSMPKKNTGFKK